MRKLLTLTLVAVSASTAGALAAALVPQVSPIAVALALLATFSAHLVWRRHAKQQRLLDEALGLLAEYRLPLPEHLQHQAPAPLRPLVRGYEQVCAEMQRRHDALAQRVERYAFLELHTEDVVMRVAASGLVNYVSPSITVHLGYTPEELNGTRILNLLHADEYPGFVESLKASARARKAVLLEGSWRSKSGRYVTMEMSVRHAYGLNGAVVESIAVARNVEARNELREQLTRAAHTDPLTGLPNRAALVRKLEGLCSRSLERPFVLFLFDLDRFKQVNDSLGHAAGDDYLIETANRVRSILRPGDTLARMGGDEFVALFEGVDCEAGAKSIAARIIDAVSQPYSCHGALLHPKTSIGIVLCNDPGLPSDELISRADRAMYEGKRQGGNLAIVYNASYSDSLRKDFDIEQQLSRALSGNRLVVHFQPIVDAHSKQPVLAEALVRMRADDGSLLSPAHFIDVAEKTGQIVQLGQWVLEQACWQVRRLEEAGSPTAISVNVSPRQLMHVNFVRSVETVLEHTGVSPSSIVLELTESALMDEKDKAEATLNHLRELGFKLALDDFGCGYSSISMLKTLPFGILKIDRAFVREAESVTVGPSTLSAIIDIGKSQRLIVIAEGVETAEQAVGLERLGCDLLQGFRFHRPMEAAAHFDLICRSRKEQQASPRGEVEEGERVSWF